MTKRVIIITILGIALAGGVYYFSDRSIFSPLPLFDISLNFTSTTTPERRAPVGWHEYRNELYTFSLFYPEGLVVKAFDEGGGAGTIVFEDEKNARGFQIFVVPYNAERITEERFRMDVPSGVKKDLSNTSVGEVFATSFYSQSAELGETWEIWFTKDGLLYEVNTFREQEAWLKEIMETWVFI